MEKHHPTLTEEDSIVPVHFQQDESSSDDQSESKVSFLCSSEDWKVNWNKQMVYIIHALMQCIKYNNYDNFTI